MTEQNINTQICSKLLWSLTLVNPWAWLYCCFSTWICKIGFKVSLVYAHGKELWAFLSFKWKLCLHCVNQRQNLHFPSQDYYLNCCIKMKDHVCYCLDRIKEMLQVLSTLICGSGKLLSVLEDKDFKVQGRGSYKET